MPKLGRFFRAFYPGPVDKGVETMNSIKTIKLNHAIFHFFVLVGSACHFVAIYFYVLPTS